MNPLNLLRIVRLARHALPKDKDKPPTALESFAPTFLKIMGIFLLLFIIALGAMLTFPQEFVNLLAPSIKAPDSPTSNITVTTPPTDTLTLTFTWDEWADIQNAAWFLQSEISHTLQLTGDTLPPSTVEQSLATIARYEELYNTVIDQAEAQTQHIPNDELNTILDYQIERQHNLIKLLNTLDEARLDWLEDTITQ